MNRPRAIAAAFAFRLALTGRSGSGFTPAPDDRRDLSQLAILGPPDLRVKAVACGKRDAKSRPNSWKVADHVIELDVLRAFGPWLDLRGGVAEFGNE
jgi:hypothetical protein